MRQVVDNGMTHLVMEVSSQAYLKNRVYGLRYDVGAFLNISPDHIGPNEHPTFEDYLAHKLMLLDHSDEVIVNAETDHFDTIYTYAKKHIIRSTHTAVKCLLLKKVPFMKVGSLLLRVNSTKCLVRIV